MGVVDVDWEDLEEYLAKTKPPKVSLKRYDLPPALSRSTT